MSDLIKIFFELDSSEWHGSTIETMWAEPLENSKKVFQIKNTPFYAKNISFLDIITAQKNNDEDSVFYFSGVVERSSHSTYRILSEIENAKFELYWKRLERIGCSYESGYQETSEGRKMLYAVDIPKTTDIYEAYKILEDGENCKIWIFEEGHVGHQLK